VLVDNNDTIETKIPNTNVSIISPRYQGPMIKYSRKKNTTTTTNDNDDDDRIPLPSLKPNEYDYLISKTGGQLKIHIRYDDTTTTNGTTNDTTNDDSSGGLYIHGFMPNSNANDGSILVGDEILSLDGYWVQGKRLDYVAKILKKHKLPKISMRVRRSSSSSSK
jgi:hypothetical protein